MAERVIIRSITITPEGVGIEYAIPSRDYLKDGAAFNHIVYLPDDTYDEYTTAIRQAAKAGVLAGLASAVDPALVVPREDDEEDDGEIGPYEYPPGQGPGTGAGT